MKTWAGMSRPRKYEQPKNQYWVPKVYTSEGAPRIATADWKVASRDRDTGRQLMDRSAIKNSWTHTTRLRPKCHKQKQNKTHLPSVHLCCLLSATRKCMKEADTSRGHQKQGEDDIVHSGEVHLDHICHDDCWAVGGALCHMTLVSIDWGAMTARRRGTVRVGGFSQRWGCPILPPRPRGWLFPNQEDVQHCNTSKPAQI